MNGLLLMVLLIIVVCLLVILKKKNYMLTNSIINTSIRGGTFTSTSVNEKSIIKINGKTYTGKGNISIKNGTVKIGDEIKSENVQIDKVTIDGNVGDINTNMDVYVGGDVTGNINNARDIDCCDVNGSVNSHRDIDCYNVGCDVTADRDVDCNNVKGTIKARRDINYGK